LKKLLPEAVLVLEVAALVNWNGKLETPVEGSRPTVPVGIEELK